MFMLPDRALRKWREARHARLARTVLETPPARSRDEGLIVFSMIGTRVLLPYLVAAKSLHQRLGGRGRFAVLDDGSLTAEDRATLDRHLDRPEVRHIAEVDTGPCPRGGTWERLLTLLDLRREAYVIQLDSDTVTIGDAPEVGDCIAAGRSFTLAGGNDAELVSLAEAARRARAMAPSAHVQAAIEQALDQVSIPGREGLRYVRGCSGFAGFAPSSDGRAMAEQFSAEAERLLGAARWAEWGSEQVTSNFVVANEPEALVLPHDRYFNFWNAGVPADARFVHFVGTYRHHGGAYARATAQAIAELAASNEL